MFLVPPPPWSEWTYCVRCKEPVPTGEAVVVINADNWGGLAHRDCEEEA